MKISYKKLVDCLQNGASVSRDSSGIMAMLDYNKTIALEEKVLEKLLKDGIVEETSTVKNRTTGEIITIYAAKG